LLKKTELIFASGINLELGHRIDIGMLLPKTGDPVEENFSITFLSFATGFRNRVF
jgi:hypothetical protein